MKMQSMNPSSTLSFPFGDPEIRRKITETAVKNVETFANSGEASSTVAALAAAVGSVAFDFVLPVAATVAVGFGIYKLFSD